MAVTGDPHAGPHDGLRVVAAGAPLAEAQAAVILLHGRGGTARDILGLARELDRAGAEVFARLGAVVDARRYPGLPHTINQDELRRVDELLAGLCEGTRPGAGFRAGAGAAQGIAG